MWCRLTATFYRNIATTLLYELPRTGALKANDITSFGALLASAIADTIAGT